MGAGATLAGGSVIRADGHYVRIGDDFHLGEFSTVHISHAMYPTNIGDRVAVGRNAVVHACTVDHDCVIEDNVVILDGSVIQSNVLIESASVVFPRSILPTGGVYSGSPARLVRQLEPSELKDRAASVRASPTAGLSSEQHESSSANRDFHNAVFVAMTARCSGKIEVGEKSSVFFSCRLDAGGASILIEENTNIQDNTCIRCDTGVVTIASNTTIGHNVKMNSCQIGERSLVGIGSTISGGTCIDSDVLLAAGSATSPGQCLERGWVWGGRPARALSKLDDAKRSMMRAILDHYYAYGHAYHRAQRQLAQGA